jgi:hypothetical protein
MMDWNAAYWLWQLLDPLLRHFDTTYEGSYDPDTVRELLQAADFQAVNVEAVRVGWIWGMWQAAASCPA